LREGAVLPWAEKNPIHFLPFLEAFVKHYKIDIKRPFKELPKQVQDIILFGSDTEEIEFYYDMGSRREFIKRPFEGVIKELRGEWERAEPYEKERYERS
jgi:excinuclease ABC subunit A